MAGGVEGQYAVLWCRFKNDTISPQREMVRLDFDPTDGWHSYELKVTIGRTFAVGEDWILEFITDGKSQAIMNGIPVFSDQARLTLAVWNRDDFVPEVQDVFSSPETTAFFRDLRFPPSADNLCRYGDPFRPGDNSVSVFYAGVGTEKLKDDVAHFREVARPCVPCVKPCDMFDCDPDCSSLDTLAFLVRIDNLTLSPNVSFKQMDGSGRTTLASSSGVYIDVTSPDIQSIDHVDMSWDDEEIVQYQGSNSTIAVRYSAFDRESQIAEYFWAIGTAPWLTDIQPLKSNGLRDMAVNYDLEGVLHHGLTYYVTLVAVNGAGIKSSETSTGVKVLLGYPNVTSMSTAVLFGEDVSNDVYPDDVVEVTDLTHVGISWERPQEEQAITSIFLSVSSTEDGINDIFPETRVGFNDSGNVVIADGKVETGGKVMNITDVCKTNAYSTKRDPGRVGPLRVENEPEEFFQGSTHFALAAVSKDLFNSRPVITSDTYIKLREDEERAILVEYSDTENDRLTFSITVPPQFGRATLRNEEVSFNTSHPCRGQNNWFSVVEAYVKSGTTGPLQLDSCGAAAPHALHDMGWVFTRLTYRPAVNFTGMDTIKINARDDQGGLSRVVNLDIYVLENLCQHGGSCVGDVTDPNCTSPQRSQGFDGYWCDCTSTPGWTGRFCGLDFDDCSSTPCPANYTCIDKLNGYLCDCGDPSWPCGHALEPWEVGVIAGGALAAAVLLILVFFWWKKWQKSCPKTRKGGSMFLKGARVAPMVTDLPLTSLSSSKPGDKQTNTGIKARAPEASQSDVASGTDEALSTFGRPDYTAFQSVPRAWETDAAGAADRQAAALLSWEWNPKHSVESLDGAASRPTRPATELRELRGLAARRAAP
uniref:EGF-like domain-containing protein n=1 Tax=Branchiostoma floridae TaxID=7739 RepID=C3ZSG0_BRAFL|eukprot:XP_002588514.1 hypothetical protein BRAFLDRAFT_79469 [Branchiostoma floridae]